MGLNCSEIDRRRAADQLGVPTEACPADVRAAFLRALPAAGFCPPPPLCAAAASLAGQPVPGAAGAHPEPPDTDDPLATEVATFARTFWSLQPNARRDRWQDLLSRVAPDPQLTARLRRLEAGVDLRDATAVPGPPRQREVIGMIQSLFVLGPIDRAARRRELLDGLPPPAAAWEQAAREVERDLPAYSTLEPALLERLGAWSRRLAAPAAGVDRPAPTWGFHAQVGMQTPQPMPVVKRPPARRSRAWTAFLWIGFMFAVGALTGVNREQARVDPAARSPLSRPEAPLGLPSALPTPAYRPLPPEAEKILNKHTPPRARIERRP
jgi:hypothetical protein